MQKAAMQPVAESDAARRQSVPANPQWAAPPPRGRLDPGTSAERTNRSGNCTKDYMFSLLLVVWYGIRGPKPGRGLGGCCLTGAAGNSDGRRSV